MKRPYPAALLAGLACLLVFASGARAGVTIDVLFQDAYVPSGITFYPPDDPGPGCVFTGYYGRSVSTGHCMDVILATTVPLIAASVSVTYDSDNGLAVASFYEWNGVGVSFDKVGQPTKSCAPAGGIADNGGILESFDCSITEPNNPPVLAAGTYRLGTIIWDLSGITLGVEAIAAAIGGGDGVDAVINGNIVDITTQVVLFTHLLTYIPEPGTAALLGLGLMGLVLTARRH